MNFTFASFNERKLGERHERLERGQHEQLEKHEQHEQHEQDGQHDEQLGLQIYFQKRDFSLYLLSNRLSILVNHFDETFSKNA